MFSKLAVVINHRILYTILIVYIFGCIKIVTNNTQKNEKANIAKHFFLYFLS